MYSYIHLCGTIAKTPLPEYTVDVSGRGTLIHRMLLDVPRLSGTVDQLPVLVPDIMMNKITPYVGELISFDGQLQSRKKWSHLFVEAAMDRITDVSEMRSNVVRLKGTLLRDPIYRITPLGREITDIMVSISGNSGEYWSVYYWTIPCVTFGGLARFVRTLHAGDCVDVIGRFQSREYTKICRDETKEKRVAYEVVARNVYTIKMNRQQPNNINREGIEA